MLADRRLGVVETKVPLVIFFCKASADPCPRHPSAGAHGIPDPTGDGVGGILNMRVKPFDNVQARRAVEGFGLGRAEVAKVIFQGRTQPLVSILARGVTDAIDLNDRKQVKDFVFYDQAYLFLEKVWLEK